MTPLALHLHTRIETHGSLLVRDYVDICMNHPDFGYYRVHDPIGTDFITSPEISPLFGQALGFWALQQWIDLGRPARWQLVELGAGRGTLMNDMVQVLSCVSACMDGLTVTLVECNRRLRDQQKASLRSWDLRITWVDDLANLSLDAPHVVVANEFLDVLPTQSYQYKNHEFYPFHVHSNAGVFSLRAHPVAEKIPAFWVNADALGENCVIETCPDYVNVLQHVSTPSHPQAPTFPGRYVFVDYGYTHDDCGANRHATLQGVQAHHPRDIFHEPGDTDLSSHVNFRAFCTIANQFGMSSSVCSQRQFLKDFGIDIRLQKLIHANKEKQQELTKGYNRLIDDMGSLFSVAQLKK